MGIFLQKIISKFSALLKIPDFKSKMAAGMNLPATLPDASFISKTKDWFTANPVKGQVLVASTLASMPSVLTEVFDSNDLPIIAKGLQDYTNPESRVVRRTLQSRMGDGIEGEAYGMEESEISRSANVIKTSIARTNEIARILAIPGKDVATLVKLITLHEPIDGEIYETMR